MFPISGRRLSIVVLALASAAGALVHAQAIERVLYVSVLDEQGQPVAGVTPDDVLVTEDDRPREVLRVSRATDPIDLAVLVDNSDALSPHVVDMRRALSAFLPRMAKLGQVAIIGLADRPTEITGYTPLASALEAGVNRIFAQPGAGSVFQDAVADAVRGLSKREAPRRVILVVTTDGTDFSNAPYERVLESIRDHHVLFSAVQITRANDALRDQASRERAVVLDEGSRKSGGRHDILLTSQALEGALAAIATELEQQYRVVYARPAALIPPKAVAVAARRPGLKARGTEAAEPRKAG